MGNPNNISINFFGSFINFKHPFFQSKFLGNFYLFNSISLSYPGTPENMYIIQKNILSTPGGGFATDFKNWISLISRLFKFSLAYSTKGVSLRTSSSQLDFWASTSIFILVQISSSCLAFWLSYSTLPFSLPTTSATSSASFFFYSTSTEMTLRSSCNSATLVSVSSNLTNPNS